MADQNEIRVSLQEWLYEILDLPFRRHGSGLT